MTSDYTVALAGLVSITLLLTGMVVFALFRPSDLPSHSR